MILDLPCQLKQTCAKVCTSVYPYLRARKLEASGWEERQREGIGTKAVLSPTPNRGEAGIGGAKHDVILSSFSVCENAMERGEGDEGDG